MMQGSSQALVLVTAYKAGEKTLVQTWTGGSVASVRKSARERYPDRAVTCKLLFYKNSYGAH